MSLGSLYEKSPAAPAATLALPASVLARKKCHGCALVEDGLIRNSVRMAAISGGLNVWPESNALVVLRCWVNSTRDMAVFLKGIQSKLWLLQLVC